MTLPTHEDYARLYRISLDFSRHEVRAIMPMLEPVESVNIRWCMSHRRETWSGRTTCVGMGGDLTGSCNVVDALLMIGEDSTP